MSQVDLTAAFDAMRDRYAKRQGPFVLSGSVTVLPDTVSVWDFMCSLADLGKLVRVLYRCRNGQARDIIGRGGVHNSTQDGAVAGIGRPMRDPVALTLSFWTATHGDKVNTGTGKGYRTLRADGILALRCDGRDFITPEGVGELRALQLAP